MRRLSGIDGPETTFEWREPRLRQRLRLLLFLGIAVLIHAGCFYLFQVVYSSSTRGIPVPMRMMVLSPDDPVAQNVLREVEDRVAGWGLSQGDRATTVSLDDYNNYEPSFAAYRPRLRELPRGPVAKMPLPGMFDEEVLPPISRPGRGPSETAPGAEPAGPTEPLVLIGGALSGRKVVEQPPLGNLFAKNHGTLASFTIGVSRSGIVEYCFPEQEFRADNLDELQNALFGILFAPRLEGGVVWGTITVEW